VQYIMKTSFNCNQVNSSEYPGSNFVGPVKPAIRDGNRVSGKTVISSGISHDEGINTKSVMRHR
jgi:hypothetical protein